MTLFKQNVNLTKGSGFYDFSSTKTWNVEKFCLDEQIANGRFRNKYLFFRSRRLPDLESAEAEKFSKSLPKERVQSGHIFRVV